MQESGYGHVGATGAEGEWDVAQRTGSELSFAHGLTLSPAVAALLRESPANYGDGVLPEHAARPTHDHSLVSASAIAARAVAAVDACSHSSDAIAVAADEAGVSSLVLRDCRATEAGMRALFAVSSQCARSLTTLDVSGCKGISLAFLSALPYGCPLAVLRADGCSSIRSVSAALPTHSALREVSLRRSPHLLSLSLAAPALEECNVSQSMQLERVALVAPKLQRFRAVHCRNVADLTLGTVPRLVELNLMGNSKLSGTAISTAVVASSALQTCNLANCLSLASLIVPGLIPIRRLFALFWSTVCRISSLLLFVRCADIHPRTGGACMIVVQWASETSCDGIWPCSMQPATFLKCTHLGALRFLP